MKMRIACYARYSSESQREESVDAQLRAIRDYAKQNNMIIVKTYVDRAMSGTKNNSLYFRNALVLSNYSNMKNNIAVNFEYLHSFYNELIGEKENKLKEMSGAKY